MSQAETMDPEPESEVLIRFQDCDPFGHLNNGRYMDYFINAREDHLAEHYGLDIYARQKEFGTNWVVSKTKIAYLVPAFFSERVAIRTRLIHYNDDTLLMEGVMLDRHRRFIKSVTWIEFRHFDLKRGQLAEHPQPLMALFARICKSGIDPKRFDQRVRQINHLQTAAG